MRKCPRCGLISPDRSVRCECGFRFDVDSKSAVLREHNRWRESTRAHMFWGIMLVALGLVVSVASYLAAVDRGQSYYSIWIGAVIVGGTLAIRSRIRLSKIDEAEQPLDSPRGPGAS
jgi:hypothetical protein